MIKKNRKKQKIAVIAGSVKEVTQKQLNYLIEKRKIKILRLNPEDLLALPSKSEKFRNKRIKEIQKKLDNICFNHDIIVVSLKKEEHNKTREELVKDSRILLQYIRKFFRYLVNNYLITGLVLTGGDTAISVCEEIDASGIEIKEEISSGIPAGILLGGCLDGVEIITKAGGFGNYKDLNKAVKYLEKERG